MGNLIVLMVFHGTVAATCHGFWFFGRFRGPDSLHAFDSREGEATVIN